MTFLNSQFKLQSNALPTELPRAAVRTIPLLHTIPYHTYHTFIPPPHPSFPTLPHFQVPFHPISCHPTYILRMSPHRLISRSPSSQSPTYNYLLVVPTIFKILKWSRPYSAWRKDRHCHRDAKMDTDPYIHAHTSK